MFKHSPSSSLPLQAVQQRLLDAKPTVVKAALQLYQVMIE
jgi:hypothetical protein